MADFSVRSNKKELLDRNDIPFEDIRRNMQELEFINSWLGGHAITLAGLKKVLSSGEQKFSPSNPLIICEIGCGGGDNLKAIDRWCLKENIPAHFIGIDINPDCIAYAKENCRQMASAEWIVSDYCKVVFLRKPIIIFSSLFCHHFTDEELIEQLSWMQKQSEMGYFINDLHRHALAYYSIKWLTSAFSRSYLVKNDAPLSVLRGFKRSEWKKLLQAAGQNSSLVEWKWAFRWLITNHKL